MNQSMPRFINEHRKREVHVGTFANKVAKVGRGSTQYPVSAALYGSVQGGSQIVPAS